VLGGHMTKAKEASYSISGKKYGRGTQVGPINPN